MDSEPTEEKLPIHAHILAGWPLLLVTVGGLLGGLCGGGAYLISIRLLQSKGFTPATGIAAFFIGTLGIVAYLALVAVLVINFPDIFGPKK